eukprot:9430145-Lingulodinium_polyedra.AAC.1
MDGANYFLSEEEARTLGKRLTRVGLTFQRLATLNANAGQMLWPKRQIALCNGPRARPIRVGGPAVCPDLWVGRL